jgi:hypothetical protein
MADNFKAGDQFSVRPDRHQSVIAPMMTLEESRR